MDALRHDRLKYPTRLRVLGVPRWGAKTFLKHLFDRILRSEVVPMKLTKRETAWLRNGPLARSGTGPVIGYKVENLPPGHEASITRFRSHWLILHKKDGLTSKWEGPYASPDAALEALERRV